jgi:hypothetical protein
MNQLGGIPERVLQFLSERIDTVPQLEAVLLMWQQAARNWSAEEIAARVYVSPREAEALLEALRRGQLVAATPEEAGRYRYDGEWDPSGERIAELAAVYARNLVQVATFIHSRGSSSVREFARAFDFKRER